jgi:hypothetical protein
MRTLVLLLSAFGICNIYAQGVIWSVTNWEAMSGAPGSDWRIAFDHVSDQASLTPPSLNPVTSIFVQRLNTNDTGDTFFATALNEPRVAAFVTAITDGTNGYLRMQAPDTSGWSTLSEQQFFGRSALAPDLAGYNITQIGFRVDNFYDFYNATDDRYFRRLDYTLDFYGSPVPEPSTWALLGLGGAVALLLRRRFRPRPPAPPQ